MQLIDETQTQAVAALESRLVDFYNTYTDYIAFNETPEYPVLWGQVLRFIRARVGVERSNPAARCRVLEIGAGHSGFGQFLLDQGARDLVHLTSQDITRTNLAHLQRYADEVLTENIDRLDGQWDIIFHSYVYEHLCRPREFNERLWSHLAPGGQLLIQSPRYDFPLYFPPCCDHLTPLDKLRQAVLLALGDVAAILRDGASRFTIYSDPAIFHLPFTRDRDAVHRVRKADLLQLFRGRARVEAFSLAAGSLKDWIVKNFLTLRVILHKKA